MNPLLFVIGGFVWITAAFKRELLLKQRSFRLLCIISLGLFAAGTFIHVNYSGRYRGSGALFNPLISLLLYRLCWKLFVMHFQREPRETWLDWRPGMAADRLFNIVYFCLGLWLWIFTSGFLS